MGNTSGTPIEIHDLTQKNTSEESSMNKETLKRDTQKEKKEKEIRPEVMESVKEKKEEHLKTFPSEAEVQLMQEVFEDANTVLEMTLPRVIPHQPHFFTPLEEVIGPEPQFDEFQEIVTEAASGVPEHYHLPAKQNPHTERLSMDELSERLSAHMTDAESIFSDRAEQLKKQLDTVSEEAKDDIQSRIKFFEEAITHFEKIKDDKAIEHMKQNAGEILALAPEIMSKLRESLDTKSDKTDAKKWKSEDHSNKVFEKSAPENIEEPEPMHLIYV